MVIVIISLSVSLGATAACSSTEVKKTTEPIKYSTEISISNDLCKGIVVTQRRGREGEVEITYSLTKNYKDTDKPSLDEALALIAEDMGVSPARGSMVASKLFKVISKKVTKKPRSEKVLIGMKEGGDCDKFIGVHPDWEKYFQMLQDSDPSLGGAAPAETGGSNSQPQDSQRSDTEEGSSNGPESDTRGASVTEPLTKPPGKLVFLDGDTYEEYPSEIPKGAKLHVVLEVDGAAKQLPTNLSLTQTDRPSSPTWSGLIEGDPAEVCSGPHRCSRDALTMNFGGLAFVFEAEAVGSGETLARAYLDPVSAEDVWKIRRP